MKKLKPKNVTKLVKARPTIDGAKVSDASMGVLYADLKKNYHNCEESGFEKQVLDQRMKQ